MENPLKYLNVNLGNPIHNHVSMNTFIVSYKYSEIQHAGNNFRRKFAKKVSRQERSNTAASVLSLSSDVRGQYVGLSSG